MSILPLSILATKRAFTVLELLVVIAIIIVLAGLTLATVGYVQNKAARSRAEAEIAAMSAALESYKADNGIYPSASPSSQSTSHGLYQALTGDGNDAIGGTSASTGAFASIGKSYMPFTNKMISPAPDATPKPDPNILVVRDPFGNAYSYSSPGAYNPTFDLWSTANDTGTDPNKWVKNW